MSSNPSREAQSRPYLRIPKYASSKDMGASTFWRLIRQHADLQALVIRPSPRITLIDAEAADAWFSRQASSAAQKVAA